MLVLLHLGDDAADLNHPTLRGIGQDDLTCGLERRPLPHGDRAGQLIPFAADELLEPPNAGLLMVVVRGQPLESLNFHVEGGQHFFIGLDVILFPREQSSPTGFGVPDCGQEILKRLQHFMRVGHPKSIGVQLPRVSVRNSGIDDEQGHDQSKADHVPLAKTSIHLHITSSPAIATIPQITT